MDYEPYSFQNSRYNNTFIQKFPTVLGISQQPYASFPWFNLCTLKNSQPI